MNHAILLLAGSSSRFNNSIQKQFYIYNNNPIFYYPLKSLNLNKNIDDIIIVTNKNKVIEVYDFAKKNNFSKVVAVIEGGTTRNESVLKGLNKYKELNANKDDIVLIHDAARPILDEDIINLAIKETQSKLATTFAIKTYDTLVNAIDYKIINYIDRDKAFRVYTPQTFRFDIITEAFEKKSKNTNDDTELVFLLGIDVHLLKGTERLFKITCYEDLEKLNIYKLK